MESVDVVGRKIGQFIKYWGFKEIHGRIWTLLFLSNTPLAPEDIEKELDISRASISLAINELLEHEVVIKVAKTAKNAQLFDVNPHIMDVISNVLRNRERKYLSTIQTTFNEAKAQLYQEPRVSKERVENLGEMVRLAVETLDSMTALKAISADLFCQFQYLPRPNKTVADLYNT